MIMKANLREIRKKFSIYLSFSVTYGSLVSHILIRNNYADHIFSKKSTSFIRQKARI